MPSEFFKASTTWVVDFRYDGHPRRWFKVFGRDIDVRALTMTELRQLYGDRVQLVEVREATEQEEGQYLRADEPKNAFCPTGWRGPDGDAICRDGLNEIHAVTPQSVSAWPGLLANHWLWGAVALSALLQVAVVHGPLPNSAFGAVPLDAMQWLVCIGMASLVLRLGEARKIVHRAWIQHVRNGAHTPSPTPA